MSDFLDSHPEFLPEIVDAEVVDAEVCDNVYGSQWTAWKGDNDFCVYFKVKLTDEWMMTYESSRYKQVMEGIQLIKDALRP